MLPDGFRLDSYRSIVFFTGAGISAESGVPTYRGAGGIWKEYDYEQYACQSAFDRDPDGVWEFHNYRRELLAKCAPNHGHELIAKWESERDGVTVVTQNVDGIHQLAGSQRVHELHGSMWQVRCDSCGARHEGRESPLEALRCDCGSYWRPNIVWFGDSMFMDVIREVYGVLESCDLLVSIGTSAVVYPAAEMPLVAQRAGAFLIEINPESTPLSDAYDVCLRGSASEMLAQLGA